MTFEEVIKKYGADEDSRVEYLFSQSELVHIVEQLRKEYAPTVEMTKSEYEIFSKAKVDEDSADWLDDVEWDRVGYKYPEFFAAWLHPETIKVLEEK